MRATRAGCFEPTPSILQPTSLSPTRLEGGKGEMNKSETPCREMQSAEK